MFGFLSGYYARDEVRHLLHYMEITLDLLLASRDERSCHQRELMASYPESTLVCLTVVMPGKIKRNSFSLTVAQAAVESIKSKLADTINLFEQRDLETGFEAYILTSMAPLEVKKQTCAIEDTHPLGRLFDIDVIATNGIPLSRVEVGFAPRKCLLCDSEARYCMRNHTHNQAEIQQYISIMVKNYLDSNQ